jgi:hypothetical protein
LLEAGSIPEAIASHGLLSGCETRFVEEEEAGGSTAKFDTRQRDWLGVSNVKFSTNLAEKDWQKKEEDWQKKEEDWQKKPG